MFTKVVPSLHTISVSLYCMCFSALAHKEFRFVLPVLPLCMHVCGYYITVLHQDRVTSDSQGKEVSQSISDEDVRHHIRKVSLYSRSQSIQ